MRAAVPKSPQIEAPDSVVAGKTTIRVATDTPGCTLCAWKGQEVYVVAQADEKGVAELQVAPASAGELVITAAGPSLNTVSKTVEVRAAD